MNDFPEKKNMTGPGDFGIGDDNESLIQRKKSAERMAPPPQAPAPRPAPGASPASQRRNNAPAIDAATRMVTPGVKPTAQQRPAAPAAQRSAAPAVQRSAAPAAQRPMAPAAQRSAAPAAQRPAQRSAAPAAQRPAAPAAQKSAASSILGSAAQLIHKPVSKSQNAPAASDGEAVPIKIKRTAPSDEINFSAPHLLRRSAQNTPEDQSTRKSDASALPVPSQNEKKPSLITGKSDRKKKAKTVSAKDGADMMSSIVKAIIYMVVVVVVATFISIFVIKIGNDVFAFVKSDVAVDVTIPEGATADDLSEILYGDGIIKYPSIFRIYASLKHDEGPFVSGSYTVTPSMSYDELRNTFKEHVATGTSWITIPEGYSTDEIIDLMVSNGIGERDKYIDVINNYDFDFWFLKELNPKDGRSYRLEGYLFPDTYEFYNASTEEMVIRKMLKRFEEVFVSDYKTKANELGYTVDEILTIASLIEKEAGGASDYMYVSSVFHNRLNNPWNYPKLESDATVVFAIQIGTGVRPNGVTHEDLSYESPYNTYLHDGLIPGPITNPSASAIRYALYPANTSYYYFVTADSGAALYAETKDEHNNNIERVKKLNKAAKNAAADASAASGDDNG